MPITGLIFNSQKVVFQGANVGDGPAGLFENVTNVLQGNLGVGGIVIDATVNESHHTACEVTNYPIESGEAISDHVQLKPAVYTMEGSISDTPLGFLILSNVINTINSLEAFIGQRRSIEAYYSLLALQKSRQPFTLISSFKRYDNMIMTDLEVTNTAETANELSFKATLQQVKIVTSQSLPSSGLNLSSGVKQKAQAHSDQGQIKKDDQPSAEDNASPAIKIFQDAKALFKKLF